MSTAAQTVKRWNLCPECVCELDWEPASGCWYCHDCCTHQDTPRVMVDAEDYTALERCAPVGVKIHEAIQAIATQLAEAQQRIETLTAQLTHVHDTPYSARR